MRTIKISGANELPIITELEEKELGESNVRVQLHFAALNHRDIWIQKGQYAGIQFPFTPGSDGYGTVIEANNPEDGHWIGKKVILNPNIAWGDKQAFQSKEYNILGMPSEGTFSEYIDVDPDILFSAPSHLSPEECAALPLAGLTAYRALYSRGQLKKGENVLISGIGGGVAQMAMMFALGSSCNVYVTTGDPSKGEMAVSEGASGYFDYKTDKLGRQILKESGGIDIAIDGAGGRGISEIAKGMNPGGRIVIYGGSQGAISDLSPQILFWKQLSILGSTMGSDSDFEKMLSLVTEKKLRPKIDEVFDWKNCEEAFQKMENGKQSGKIVLKIH